MRAFVGIELAHEWKQALGDACGFIRDTDESWRSEKWVSYENLHLTLKFLGDISQETALTLAEDLRLLSASTDPFALEPDEYVRAVPSERRASMLWCTFLDREGDCSRLANEIERLTERYSVDPDKRSFVPHATLVRARKPHRFEHCETASEVAASRLRELAVESMSVRDVTFFRSTLTRTGPRYERLALARLGG